MPSIAGSVIVPLMGRINELKARDEWRNMTGLGARQRDLARRRDGFEAVLKRLAAYKRVVVLSGEVHWGSSAQISYWRLGTKRHVLAPALRAELDAEGKTIGPGLKSRVLRLLRPTPCGSSARATTSGCSSTGRCRSSSSCAPRRTASTSTTRTSPARFAQFTSSGMKNIKALIAGLARGLGFAFSLIDLTPVERLVWADKTPGPLEPPPGGRFHPAVRDRLGGEPVTVPSGNWPAGTTLKRAPDACWRLDLVRDERPESQRVDFTRAVAMPGFDNTKIEESYGRIAAKHAEHLLTEKLRFTRGAIYQSNVGLVRFEGAAARASSPATTSTATSPGRTAHGRSPCTASALAAHGEQRPQLRFDL